MPFLQRWRVQLVQKIGKGPNYVQHIQIYCCHCTLHLQARFCHFVGTLDYFYFISVFFIRATVLLYSFLYLRLNSFIFTTILVIYPYN